MLPPEVFIDALIYSNLLSLLAIGLTLTYLTLKVPNFAYGDLATIGIYVAFTFNEFYSLHPYLTPPLAFITAGLVSLASYILVFRPLWRRESSIVTLMIASIAVEIALRSMIHIYASALGLRRRVSLARFDEPVSIASLELPSVLLATTLTAITLVCSLYLFLNKTKFGTAMRAAIENPYLASTLGINVEQVYAVSWFLAGGLAGVAGLFLPFRISATPETGWELLLRIFAASVLGGLNSIFGAILGGYITGFAEVVGIYLLSRPPLNISTAYRPAIPFALFIVVLLVLPQGITGINWRRLKRKILRGEKE